MTKIGRFLLVLLFLVPLVLMACAGQQATPTPAATTATPPKSAATEKGAAATQTTAPPAKPKEAVKMEILATRSDMSGFPLSQGMADIIGKNSTWLKASNVQTPGMSAAMQMFVKEVDQRATRIVVTTEDPITDATRNLAWGPVNKILFLFRMGPTPVSMCALDPKLKTKDDLIGKRIGLHRPGTFMAECEREVLRSWGIIDKVKIVEGSFGEQATALKDGLIDTTMQTVDCVGLNQYAISSVVSSAAGGSPIYYIPIDKATMDDVYKRTKSPYGSQTLPPGTLGPTQTQPLGVMGQESFWVAGSEMSEDMAYEIVKLSVENISQFALYHVQGKSMTKQGAGLMFRSAPERYHPGAAKYFKEAGIPMGEVEWNR